MASTRAVIPLRIALHALSPRLDSSDDVACLGRFAYIFTRIPRIKQEASWKSCSSIASRRCPAEPENGSTPDRPVRAADHPGTAGLSCAANNPTTLLLSVGEWGIDTRAEIRSEFRVRTHSGDLLRVVEEIQFSNRRARGYADYLKKLIYLL